MNINPLHENRLIALPQKELALAWLVENGPLVADPPLSMAALRALVSDQRILRLRSGLYLAPMADGHLPTLPRTIELVDPDGYISGHGALMLRGLNDQDISRWYSITSHRQADIDYGPIQVHFVVSPARAATAARTSFTANGQLVSVATAAQALIDEVSLRPYGLDYIETTRVLRNTIESGQVTAKALVEILIRFPSVAAARRIGFMWEMGSSKIDPALLRIAHSQDGITHIAGDNIHEHTWRIFLPHSRAEIVGGIS